MKLKTRLLLSMALASFNLFGATYYWNGGTITALSSWPNAKGGSTFASNFTTSGDIWDLNLASSANVDISGWSTNGKLTNSAASSIIATLTTTSGDFTSSYVGAVWVVPATNLVVSGINIIYSAAGATIPGLTYANLRFSNSTGTCTAAAAISVSGTLTTTSGGTLAMGSNTLTLSGTATTLTNGGTITTSATTAFTDSRTTKTFGGTITYSALAGVQTIATGNYATLTLSNTSGTNTAVGAISVSGTLTTTSGGTLAMGSNTLTLSGTATTLTNGGTITTSATTAFTDSRTTKTFGGTVNYGLATGAQTIARGDYSTLTLSNTSGTNTAAGAITVSGTLTTTSGGTLAMGSNTLTLSGTATTLTNGGTITTSATTAFTDSRTTKTFGGTINYNRATGSRNIAIGNYTNLTLSNSSGTYTALGAITVSGTLTTTSGGTLAMGANTLTLSGTATLTNGGTITTSATTAFTDSRTTKTFGGTVNYGLATGGQTIASGSYSTLTLSNTSGTNTAGGAITVTNAFAIPASTTLNMSTNGLTCSSNLTNSGTLKTSTTTNPAFSTITASIAGTVEFAAVTGGQFIPGKTYANLTLNNTSGTNTTVNAVISVSGTLTTAAGGTLDMTSYNLTATSIANSGTIKTNSTSSTPLSTNTTSIGGTFEYGSPTTQNIGLVSLNPVTFLNLTLSGSNATGVTKTLVGNIVVTGVFKRLNGAKVGLGSGFTITNANTPVDEFNLSTVTAGTYNNALFSYQGTTEIGGTVDIGGSSVFESGCTVQVNSGGTLKLTGTLLSGQTHVINGPIKLNGGDFIVSGQKDKDVNYSAASGTPPFMIINGSITDVLTTGFRSNSIRFLPSNSGTNKVSHIRFVGSALTLGNSSNSFNGSIQANEKAYFEIGDGSTSTTLTINDTLRLLNGLRTRASATLTTNGMLTLTSSKDNQSGAGKSIGYVDTCVSGTISGNVNLVETMSASRKFRFLGNPFTGSLSITDFTDDIDITGDRSGTANNNFTQTITDASSAYTYNNSTDAWVAITNTAPTVLSSLQGMRILIRGEKGYGLNASNGSPTSSRIVVSGSVFLGDQTISLANGYNLITNPFLSMVDLTKISKTTSVGDNVYMYSPASSGFQTFNKNSGNVSSGGADVWTAGSSMFFYASASGQSITIEEVDKKRPTDKSYNGHFEELDTLYNIGNVVVKNDLGRESLVDGITLDFGGRATATDNFDELFDGLDFGSDSVNLALISKDNKYLAYAATNPLTIDEFRRYPLSLAIRNSTLNGNYTLQFDQFKSFQADMHVVLIDKWLNTTTDLITNPQYKFQVSDKAESLGAGRFEIGVSKKSTVNIDELLRAGCADFIVSNDIDNNTVAFTPIGNGANKTLSIYDLQGKLIHQFDRFNTTISQSNDQLASGVYIATVVSGQTKSTKKFIITN